jgi:hypothetical protein
MPREASRPTKGETVPVSPSFWRWVFTTVGSLLAEALFEALFGGGDDDRKKRER